jgi:hypothetical protein
VVKEVSVVRSNEDSEKSQPCRGVFNIDRPRKGAKSLGAAVRSELRHDSQASQQSDEVCLPPRLCLGEQGAQL